MCAISSELLKQLLAHPTHGIELDGLPKTQSFNNLCRVMVSTILLYSCLTLSTLGNFEFIQKDLITHHLLKC